MKRPFKLFAVGIAIKIVFVGILVWLLISLIRKLNSERDNTVMFEIGKEVHKIKSDFNRGFNSADTATFKNDTAHECKNQ